MSSGAWEDVRKAALFRDRAQCQDCGHKSHRVHVHHITPRSEGGEDKLENLTTLCPTCHAERHDAYACSTCGGILHERDTYERGLMDKKGGSPVIICDECWRRISSQGAEDGCRLCDASYNDTRYSAGIGSGCALPEYDVCDDCRKRLLSFSGHYATMKFYDEHSPINFRHWEAGDD